MKKCLTLLFFAISLQVVAQTYPITGINISLPANPDANTINWGSGTSMLSITATTKAENGRVTPHVVESKLLVTIKKGGAKICGIYTGNSAPASGFNSITKVWSGTNAVALLGQDCVLPPGDYEICVQFFGNGPVGMAPLSEEKCKPFSIREKEQQIFQSPQIIAPVEGTILSEADVKNPITFRWIPVIPRPQDPVTYRLTIWQLMQGQTGTQAMKANQPIITKDVDNITQAVVNNLTSGPCLPQYLCDFIWNVQALKQDGKPIGENNGTSKPSVFNIANNEQIKNTDGRGDIVDQKGTGTIILDLPLEPDDTTLFIIYNGCPRHNVSWTNIAAELNIVSHCAVPVSLCVSYDQLTTENHYLWQGTFSHTFPVSEQNAMMAQARQWALNNRPVCSNNTLKSIIAITYLTDIIVNDENNNNVVGFSVQYGCCTAVGNHNQQKIYLTSPEDQAILKTSRPIFEWKMEPALENVTYSITVKELEEGKDIESGKILFERGGIRENVFRYPAEVLSLDSSKAYSWGISAYNKNKVLIGKANPAVFALPPPLPSPICMLFSWAYPNKVCLGSPSQISFYLFGGSGSLSWSLSNGQTGTTSPITVNPFTTPGVNVLILTVTRGNCTRIKPISFYVYPNLTAQILDYPSGNPISSLCWGEDATLKMNGVPASCQVTWDYNTGGGWLPVPGGGVGNMYNTNQINWFSCTGTFVNVQFRGTTNPDCLGLPSGWPSNCSNVAIKTLKVWCKPQAGNITASPPSQCAPPYNPIQLNIGGTIGSLTWSTTGGIFTPASPTISNPTITFPMAGNYTVTCVVTNGNCPSIIRTIQIIVENPPSATLTSDKNVVCWGKDATLTLSNIQPSGATIQWEYSINNCSAPWTSTGVTGTVQHTNELFGPSYPGIFPPTSPPCYPNKICWRAKVTSPTSICQPTFAGPLTIDVIVPPTPPTITPLGPIVKCYGQPVTLTAIPPSCGTPPLTYMWFLNGLPVTTGQTIQATDPGNYFVVVTNKNNCASVQSSNTVTVRDCVTKVVVLGPCTCSPNTTITLTAIATSTVEPSGPPGNCGQPYTYLWSTGATTQSITNIPCPQQTTTYWVQVTNAMGCIKKVYHTIKKCQ